MAAAIWTISLAAPSRSSRASSEACRLAGSAGDTIGGEGASRRRALVRRLQHGLRDFLREERDAAGALDDVEFDAFRQRLVGGDVLRPSRQSRAASDD